MLPVRAMMISVQKNWRWLRSVLVGVAMGSARNKGITYLEPPKAEIDEGYHNGRVTSIAMYEEAGNEAV